jgi:hypothetical protein
MMAYGSTWFHRESLKFGPSIWNPERSLIDSKPGQYPPETRKDQVRFHPKGHSIESINMYIYIIYAKADCALAIQLHIDDEDTIQLYFQIYICIHILLY